MLAFLHLSSPASQLDAARAALAHVAELLNARFSVRLWDGSVVPMGGDVQPHLEVAIQGPGVIGSLIRRPTLDNLVRHFATGQLEIRGGDMIEFFEAARVQKSRARLKQLRKSLLLRSALPFLLVPAEKAQLEHEYAGDEVGRATPDRKNQDYVRFHYDASNEFYQLFLGAEMQYSCGYFTDWSNTLEQAQHDKLEMICRKLRLKPGERMLDIGCGWGGLICYAAQHYGVTAKGVTLSQAQHDFVQAKIRRLGLERQVTVELRDYNSLDGEYDKITSICMYEHVGVANHPTYFRKLYSLLRDRGILLNQGITRPAKFDKRRFNRIRAPQRLLLKYIFPGCELDHIGHTCESMEACRFEVHDVEDWREHYALTARHWCQRLSARREEAIKLFGAERYRLWVAYLAGVSFGFLDGSLRVYQVVASKHADRGAAQLPPTRVDLYRAA
jgi:cyclopropane-fatty-acyl-phospholipid synthase